VFIGPMAAGKSKLGKRVAALLRTDFTDTDKVIVAEHGDISTIFAEHGEPAFRDIERAAVREALQRAGVVSLGGGAILNQETQRDLRDLPVVYVHVTPEAVASRIQNSSRPLLTDGVAGWQRIFEQRRPIYEDLADIDFDTSTAHLGDIASTIAAWVRAREGMS
jgi:shikimate kinase